MMFIAKRKNRMVELPQKIEYKVKLVWDAESGGNVYITDFPKLKIDMPVEFGGKGRFPCPDELFFSAVGGCFLTTFLYFKERLKIKLRDLQILVQGTVENVGPKGYRISEIQITMNVDVDEEEKLKAEECAELTKDFCHLTRSLETGIPIKVTSNVKKTL
jgi:organic hydroperoxide reductase OsmC/OhrA